MLERGRFVSHVAQDVFDPLADNVEWSQGNGGALKMEKENRDGGLGQSPRIIYRATPILKLKKLIC